MPTKNDQGVRGVDAHQDYQNVVRQYNLPDAASAQEPMTKSQTETLLATKQANVTGGNGIQISGTEIEVDLATAGSDFGVLSITGAPSASLVGEYTRTNYSAEVQQSGQAGQLDLIIGDTDIDWNGYYKYNGSGIWAVCFKNDDDGNQATDPNAGAWMVVLTTTDPSTLTYSGSGTQTVSSFIPDYFSVDFYPATTANESSGDGKFSPSSTAPTVSYPTGATPAGLLFDAGKLAIDFAQTIAANSSTKVFPSSVIKTYVDDQATAAKDLSNNPFNNAIAQITGNPTNAQSALEDLAAEIDVVEGNVSAATTVNAEQTADITAHSTTLGVSDGDTNLGDFTDPDLIDNASVKAVFEGLASTSRTSDGSLAEVLGVSLGDTDLGLVATSIVPDNSDVKEAVEALGSNIEEVQLATRKPLGLVDYIHNADVASGGVALTAGQLAGTEAFNTTVVSSVLNETFDLTGLSEPVSILVSYGKEVGSVDAGVYIRDNVTGFISRSPDFDETGEIPANGYWQVINELTGSLAYSFFSVQNSTDPVVGTDPIKIGLDSLSGIGNGTITEPKLSPELRDKIYARPVYEQAQVDVSTPDNGQYSAVIAHTYGTAIAGRPLMFDSATGEVQEFEVFITNNQIKIVSVTSFGNGSGTGLTVNYCGLELEA